MKETRIRLEDLEFFAEDGMIEIISNIRMNKLKMISGDFGPFEPMERANVPLWLALVLKRNGKCRIVIPDWLKLDYLRQTLEKDKSTDLRDNPSLCELPDHYIEISRLLMESCPDDVPDFKEVRSLLDSIVKVRENRLNEFRGMVINYVSTSLEQKFNHGEYQEFVRRPFYDVITGASSVEVSRLRSQFIPVLEELNKNEDVRKHLLSNR